jgi:GMP synthase (glutamine-hydrolysing)
MKNMKKMRVHYIAHSSFVLANTICSWASENKYQLNLTCMSSGDQLPDVNDFDFLIIMGGQQSVLEKERYPYLDSEITLIKNAITANKMVLGICLGAQLISAAVGDQPCRSPQKEIGIFPVKLTHAGKEDPILSQLPEQFAPLHWHSDMAGPSTEATILAQSEGCPCQAFRYGKKVYGLQFHLEYGKECVECLVNHFSSDITPGPYVQNPQEILQQDFSPMNHYMRILLDKMVQVLGA